MENWTNWKGYSRWSRYEEWSTSSYHVNCFNGHLTAKSTYINTNCKWNFDWRKQFGGFDENILFLLFLLTPYAFESSFLKNTFPSSALGGDGPGTQLSAITRPTCWSSSTRDDEIAEAPPPPAETEANFCRFLAGNSLGSQGSRPIDRNTAIPRSSFFRSSLSGERIFVINIRREYSLLERIFTRFGI